MGRLIHQATLNRENHCQENIPLTLSSEDKRLFDRLCQFAWIQGEPMPLVFDVDDVIYTSQGITLPTLKRLQALGLILLEADGFVKKGFGKHARLFYGGRLTKIGFKNDGNNALDLGHVLLTAQGKQLSESTKPSSNQQFYEYVIQRWFRQGLTLTSIQISRN